MSVIANDNYKEYFGQTSKAVLFETFSEYDQDGNPREGLDSLLKDFDKDKDRFETRLDEEFTVRSFREFVEKFAPYLYPVEKSTAGDAQSKINVDYTVERPDGWDPDKMPQPLEENVFYKAVMRMYNERKQNGKPNRYFDQSEFEAMLGAEKQMENYKRIRVDLKIAQNKYQELLAIDAPNDQINEQVENINDCMDRLEEGVSSGFHAILPLLLADSDKKYLELKKGIEQNDSGDQSVPFIPERIQATFDENGNLKCEPIQVNTQEEEVLRIEQKDTEEQIEDMIREAYKDGAPEALQNNKYVENALVEIMTGGNQLISLQDEQKRQEKLEEMIRQREERQQTYRSMLENMMDALAPVVEKFLGVCAFFDNATVDGELESELVVTNCTVEKLIETDEMKKGLENFLGQNHRKKKIWFGILPAVAMGDEKRTSGKVEKRLSLGERREKKEEKNTDLTSASQAKTLLDICQKAKVVTIFNYKATEETSFTGLTIEKFRKMKDLIQFPNEGKYAVCAFPNFTICKKHEYILNEKFVDLFDEDKVKVGFPAMYVEAAYVAAGMIVGSQQPNVLKKKKIIIDPKNTCVRVNFEESRVQKKYLSTMSVESSRPMDDNLQREIMEERFGFFFNDSGINDSETGADIQRVFVENARTMYKKDEKYREVYRTLFGEFMDLCVKEQSGPYADTGRVNHFYEEDIEKWKTKCQEVGSKEIVNLLLNEYEDIILASDFSGYTITFREGQEKVEFETQEA